MMMIRTPPPPPLPLPPPPPPGTRNRTLHIADADDNEKGCEFTLNYYVDGQESDIIIQCGFNFSARVNSGSLLTFHSLCELLGVKDVCNEDDEDDNNNNNNGNIIAELELHQHLSIAAICSGQDIVLFQKNVGGSRRVLEFYCSAASERLGRNKKHEQHHRRFTLKERFIMYDAKHNFIYGLRDPRSL
jgi:hypothetical protein